MIRGKKIIVVLPAYNAEKTLANTYAEIPHDLVDEIILVDDGSTDHTAAVARELGLEVIVHAKNMGYGANQKTCYKAALARGADLVVMLHPDYQYSPKLIPAMLYLLAETDYEVVLGSRILGGRARKGGMPLYKYFSNRVLTFVQNLLMAAKLSEYHTGYRAFTRRVLETLPFENNSDDFVFDNQMLAQIIYLDFLVAEITCPAKYFPEASSINFTRSLKYGLGCLRTAVQFRLNKLGLLSSPLFATLKPRSRLQKDDARFALSEPLEP
ncbi:glycosyltransferase family 2 protein [candidate division KSB1 bacterium]|nr:glycosyltransferase family 2 protein [candidate division KSB1 bacterium]